MKLVFYSIDSGQVSNTAEVFSSEAPTLPPTMGFLVVDEFPQMPCFVLDGETCPLPAPPTPFHLFRRGEWVLQDLEPLREGVITQLNRLRSQKEAAGINTCVGLMDSDPTSMQKLMGAALMLQSAPQQEILWTLADNSTAVLSTANISQVVLDVTTAMASIHYEYAALKATVRAAGLTALLELYATYGAAPVKTQVLI
jgi:hypothetical protein